MKTTIKILFTALLAVTAFQAGAQYRWYGYPNPYRRMQDNMERNRNPQRVGTREGPSKLVLNLNYGISLPTGDLHQYANKPSFNGWNASLLYQINPKLAAGLGFGFYDFYQKIPRQVYAQDKYTDISAVPSHTLQYMPIQPTVIYTPGGNQGAVQPYIGLGVGGALVDYGKFWGEFEDKDNKFAFSVTPMAGIHIPFGKTSPLKMNVGVKYNYIPYSYNEIHSLGAVEGDIGISLHLR